MKALIRKYVAIGPESTGKSTLCQKLATHYHSVWCREYAREYLEKYGSAYDYGDLLTIAKGQLKNEADSLSRMTGDHSGLLFIDTDMQVMRIWCEYVYNDCHKFILDQIAERPYDGYFLCTPDLPWVQDPLREYPEQRVRDELFLYYKELLTAQKVPWICIDGAYEKRFSDAIGFIDAALNQHI